MTITDVLDFATKFVEMRQSIVERQLTLIGQIASAVQANMTDRIEALQALMGDSSTDTATKASFADVLSRQMSTQAAQAATVRAAAQQAKYDSNALWQLLGQKEIL